MARCGACQTINRGLNTPNRRCVQCNHPMVFNAANDGFSDMRLMRAMDRLSAGGRLMYTERQLYHAVSGRRTAKAGVVKRLRRAARPPEHSVPTLPPGRFQTNLARWYEAGGSFHGRLLSRDRVTDDPNRQQSDGPGLHPELAAHGFDRAVVVDHAPTAVMLVANNFHVDHRCAILSEDGYPEGFRPELIEVLNRNPRLVVAALHDASFQGMGMVRRLRAWFPDPKIRLIEVGLRPAQAIKANFHAHRDKRREPDPAVLEAADLRRLPSWEREWLAWGLSSRLDGVSPQGLMTAISRVFNTMARLDEASYVSASAPRSSSGSVLESGGFDPGGFDEADAGIFWWDHSVSTGDNGTPATVPDRYLDDRANDQGNDFSDGNLNNGDSFAHDGVAFEGSTFDGDDEGFDGSDFDGDG